MQSTVLGHGCLSSCMHVEFLISHKIYPIVLLTDVGVRNCLFHYFSYTFSLGIRISINTYCFINRSMTNYIITVSSCNCMHACEQACFADEKSFCTALMHACCMMGSWQWQHHQVTSIIILLFMQKNFDNNDTHTDGCIVPRKQFFHLIIMCVRYVCTCVDAHACILVCVNNANVIENPRCIFGRS